MLGKDRGYGMEGKNGKLNHQKSIKHHRDESGRGQMWGEGGSYSLDAAHGKQRRMKKQR